MKPRSVFAKIAMGVLLTAVLLPVFCFSVSAKNTTTLTTTVPSSFQLSVEIEGNGTVVVNSEKFTHSAVIEVERNVLLEISVIADDGYEVKSVLYNQKDITDKLQKGEYQLSVIDSDGILSVTFIQAGLSDTGDSGETDSGSSDAGNTGETDSDSSDSEITGTGDTENPTTGDQSRYVVITISLVATASILAMIVLLAAIKKRKSI